MDRDRDRNRDRTLWGLLAALAVAAGSGCAPPSGNTDGGGDAADGGEDAAADADAADDAGPEVCVFDAGTPLPVEDGGGKIGSPCDPSHACVEGECDQANYPGGYCIGECLTSEPRCPPGTTCVGACFKSCTADADCGRGDYVCWDEFVAGPGGICTYDCRLNPICPPPGFPESFSVCDCETGTCTGTAGYAQPCGASVGAFCRRPLECILLQGGTPGTGYCSPVGCANVVPQPGQPDKRCPKPPATATCINITRPTGEQDTACAFFCDHEGDTCPEGLTCKPFSNRQACLP